MPLLKMSGHRSALLLAAIILSNKALEEGIFGRRTALDRKEEALRNSEVQRWSLKPEIDCVARSSFGYLDPAFDPISGFPSYRVPMKLLPTRAKKP